MSTVQYCNATRKKMQNSDMFKINVALNTSTEKFAWDNAVSVYYKQNNT